MVTVSSLCWHHAAGLPRNFVACGSVRSSHDYSLAVCFRRSLGNSGVQLGLYSRIRFKSGSGKSNCLAMLGLLKKHYAQTALSGTLSFPNVALWLSHTRYSV